jgi:hypothetical protein
MRSMEPAAAREVLARMAEGQAISKVQVSVDGDGGFRYEIA